MLECLKKCIDDFHGHNIEIITNLLETCGKYLIKVEESKLKFTTLLDILWRLKDRENISTKALQNLENAYYQCRAPANSKKQPKIVEKLTNMQ